MNYILTESQYKKIEEYLIKESFQVDNRLLNKLLNGEEIDENQVKPLLTLIARISEELEAHNFKSINKNDLQTINKLAERLSGNHYTPKYHPNTTSQTSVKTNSDNTSSSSTNRFGRLPVHKQVHALLYGYK